MEGYERLEMLVDGEWIGRAGRKTQPVVNPATEEVLGELPLAANADLDRALEASLRGFRTWKGMSPLQRQAVMERAASLLEHRKEQIARTCTMEMGKPLTESRMEVDFVAGVLRWYGEEGKRAYGRLIPTRLPGVRQMVMKEPVGPVAAFVAWNFPGTNVIRKIAGALGAGCSIIIKASEETPGTAVAIARCFQDAGLPNGVLNLVFGVPDEVSRYLLASPIPRKVSFTGSVGVGKHLQKLAADTLKRCTMELGGHAPVVVFDDADLSLAVKQTVAFKFRNAGQVCISPTRFFVQAKVYDRFAEMFVQEARKIAVGNGLDESVQMGPLVAQRRLTVMERFVSDAQEKGAEILCGGKRIGNRGYFFEPTVLGNVAQDAMIMNEEPFGPLAPMATFTELEEAVDLANRLPFGLASYVYTQSPSRRQAMEERIEAGLVGVNHTMVSLPETPFGGVNESGYGSEGGIEGLDAYLRTKFVTELNQ